MLDASNRMFGVVGKRTGISQMFGWFQRLLPQQGNFFDLFEAHATTLVAGRGRAGAAARRAGRARPGISARIEEREHDADDITREVLQTVRRTFLTPFDRGAITDLIAAMDDTIDEMQSTANAVDLYEITEFEPEMRDMAAIIVDAARLTAEAMPLLRRVADNGHRLHELTERIVRMEGHADEIHAAGPQAHPTSRSARRTRCSSSCGTRCSSGSSGWSTAFEDVANEIDGIVIDHA